MKKVKKKLDVVSIARGLACLGVLSVHLGQLLKLEGSIRVITDFGKYGVMVFLILSGFLAFSSTKSWKVYYLQRAVKILPVYYLVITFYFFLYTYFLNPVPDEYGIGWFRYFMLVNCVVPDDGWVGWYNLGLTWTIFVFVFFYMIFPLLRKWCRSFKTALFFEIAFIVIQRVYGIFQIHWFWPLSYMLYLGLGILLYFSVVENKEQLLIVLLGVGTILEILQSGYESFIYAQLFTIMLAAVIHYNLNNIFLKKVLFIIDEYSYCFYLIQGVFYETISASKCGQDMSKIWILVLMIIGTGAFTWVVHNFFEKPVQRYLLEKINN